MAAACDGLRWLAMACEVKMERKNTRLDEKLFMMLKLTEI
jgi:hypothetical protein